MQINDIAKATVIEFKWKCGCRHIIEKSECGKFRIKDHCDKEHGRLFLSRAQRRLFN